MKYENGLMAHTTDQTNRIYQFFTSKMPCASPCTKEFFALGRTPQCHKPTYTKMTTESKVLAKYLDTRHSLKAS